MLELTQVRKPLMIDTVRAAVCVVCAVIVAVWLGGCSKEYSRNTPEATIETARQMILNGDGKRVGELIYAENEDEARLMRRLGRMLGNLNDLGNAIQEKFPEDVAKLKARAEESAKSGKGGTMVNRVFSQMRGQQQRRGQRPGQQSEQLFNDLLKTIFADPYGWLKESEDKITTAYMTEDLVAVLWEGKPIMPPIGVTMRKDAKGQWAFVVPNNLPGVRDFWPNNEDEFQIWGGLIQVFDNVVIDLAKDVREGRASSLDDVARRAGEKTFVPAVITVFAFGQLQEAQKKELRAKKEAEQKAKAAAAEDAAGGSAQSPAKPDTSKPDASKPAESKPAESKPAP